MPEKIDLDREHITTSEASKRSDLSQGYLTQLLREHSLEGFQMGREWFIYTDSLEKFLATPRKSGPKGPRKKATQKQQDTLSSQNGSTS